MVRFSRLSLVAVTSSLIGFGSLPVAAQHNDGADWWVAAKVKAQTVYCDPGTLQTEIVIDELQRPMGILSPDGTKVAYVGTEEGSGRHSDLFVADVDHEQLSGKANIRRLTTDQDRPVGLKWMPDGTGLVFESGEPRSSQVWHVGLDAGAEPKQLSDGRRRAFHVRAIDEKRIAYLIYKGSEKKESFIDLVIQSIDDPKSRRTVLEDKNISSFAVSPDGRTLAWSGLGSMYFVDLGTGESRDVPLHGVHPQLVNHTAHEMAWRPDGNIIAIKCGFLGGISREFGTPEDEPWPRMFAADKIFFVPVDWKPDAESIKVGEGADFPAPWVTDEKAEISPPAGDERQPWWVVEVPERVLGLEWVRAEVAQAHVARRVW